MTEEEAKKLWCPMARVAAQDTDGANRNYAGAPHFASPCIASSCMAWRWDSKTTGYCGLAGRPAA